MLYDQYRTAIGISLLQPSSSRHKTDSGGDGSCLPSGKHLPICARRLTSISQSTSHSGLEATIALCGPEGILYDGSFKFRRFLPGLISSQVWWVIQRLSPLYRTVANGTPYRRRKVIKTSLLSISSVLTCGPNRPVKPFRQSWNSKLSDYFALDIECLDLWAKFIW